MLAFLQAVQYFVSFTFLTDYKTEKKGFFQSFTKKVIKLPDYLKKGHFIGVIINLLEVLLNNRALIFTIQL